MAVGNRLSVESAKVERKAAMATFEEAIEQLASKIEEYAPTLETEEATKNAIIMPFIAQVLGYDVFDPSEVSPEFTADIGTKRGEKIDYAILHDGQVQMLIECKRIGAPLDINHASQLFRYFHASNARIGVLTNGKLWHFFTDLDNPNRMDEKPFLRLDLGDVDPYTLPELKKLTKSAFDLDSVLNAAEELKYVSSLKRELGAILKEPDDEFARLLIARVYDRSATARVKEFFRPLIAKACRQWLSDQVNDRLKAALQGQAPAVVAPQDEGAMATASAPVAEVQEEAHDGKSGIETTLEEVEGFNIVRAIAVAELAPERIFARDTKSYFGVLVDDNNRKPLCRLHFNARAAKYLGLFDAEKVETKYPIEAPVDIYRYAEQIREAAKRYG